MAHAGRFLQLICDTLYKRDSQTPNRFLTGIPTEVVVDDESSDVSRFKLTRATTKDNATQSIAPNSFQIIEAEASTKLKRTSWFDEW